MDPIRRVVTGHDAKGRSIVSEDAVAANALGAITNIWATAASPAPVDAGDAMDGPPKRLTPFAGGTSLRFFEVMPEGEGARTPEAYAAVRAAYEYMGAGDALVDTTRHPAMHKTETVDYVIVLKGELTLLLDDGEVTLKPMDSVIQRGTNHAWVNYGTEPALAVVILMDGTYGDEFKLR